jgi:hypothetical protein
LKAAKLLIRVEVVVHPDARQMLKANVKPIRHSGKHFAEEVLKTVIGGDEMLLLSWSNTSSTL